MTSSASSGSRALSGKLLHPLRETSLNVIGSKRCSSRKALGSTAALSVEARRLLDLSTHANR